MFVICVEAIMYLLLYNLDNPGFPLGQGSQGKSGNLLDGQGKSGKLEIFWKKSGKSQGRKFLSMQFFNFNKKNLHIEMYLVELYTTINSTYAIICI